MTAERRRGSIIYEFIILILILVLIGSIIYPSTLWEREKKNTELCRQRMSEILDAELLYMSYHNAYCDTLEKVFAFIKADSPRGVINQFIKADTSLAEEILKFLRADIYGAAVVDSVIKSFKKDTLLIEIDTSAVALMDSLKADTVLSTVIDSIVIARLNSLYTCPTVGDTHKITLMDSAGFKYVNIECPIDTNHIMEFNKKFLASRIGALKVKNHGKIFMGEKSWERE